MKTIILAGGFGTRLAEETEVLPKPMVEIGGRPILWHIMKLYAHHGFDHFCVALGYKGDVIKSHFLNYYSLNGDLSIDLSSGAVTSRSQPRETWRVDLIDTGLHTGTGGRVKRLARHIGDETFMVTYGDGVSNIDIGRLVAFHRAHGRLATLTAVRPPARFGGIVFAGDRVCQFTEKPQIGEGWINGGFLVFEPRVLDYLAGDEVSLEADLMEELAARDQLMAYRHEGFWQCMDTKRDLLMLRRFWDTGVAEWKVW